MTETSHRPDQRSLTPTDFAIIAGLLIWGSAFLMRMAYLRIWLSTPICIAWLSAIYLYVKQRFDLKIPIMMLALVYASVALDGLGNLFGLYSTTYKYFQYDEFTHTAIPALTAPVIVWLLNEGLKRFGHRLPLWVVTFFAITTMFTISGFYEVIEYWDDKYFWPQPGMRIHGAYDTPNDLQCDLIGMIVGGVAAFFILRSQEMQTEELDG
ncbi:MAG: hypothetical protein ACKVZH_21530 [Blastocatellia bacterium]